MNFCNFFAILLVVLLKGDPNCAFQHVMNGKTSQEFRSSKWLPFIIIVKNEPCSSLDLQEVGTCTSRTQCKNVNGSPKGKCASGFGVCCVIVKTCFDTISQNNTYFRSAGFPDHFVPNENQNCDVKINKPSKDVCQVLLTFHEMDLAKGDKNGHCIVDNIQFFGMINQNMPNLCGPLSKQHLYLEFGRGSQITFSVSTNGRQANNARKWNVQIAYIRCDDPFRAPAGCLQYFTKSSGTAKILGYPENPHLAGLQYTICVRKELGAESIFWFPCREVPFEKAFHFQGPSFLTTSINVFWTTCTDDYITIMSDSTSTVFPNPPFHRYCGNRLTAFPPFFINSKATLYIIVVRTDFTEAYYELENAGFCLEWSQKIWKPKTNAQELPFDLYPPVGP